jgi:hypothetical protein
MRSLRGLGRLRPWSAGDRTRRLSGKPTQQLPPLVMGGPLLRSLYGTLGYLAGARAGPKLRHLTRGNYSRARIERMHHTLADPAPHPLQASSGRRSPTP